MSVTACFVTLIAWLVVIGLLAWFAPDKSSDDDRDNWFW